MTVPISQVTQIEFDSQVKRAYQAGGKLRQTIRSKTGVVGPRTEFRRSGKGMAQPRIPQTDIVPMNVPYAEVYCYLAPWQAGDYCDKTDLNKVNFDERTIIAENVADAMGRREDQMIIDAWNTGKPTVSVDTNVGGAGSGLNVAKLRALMGLMDDAGVPEADRHICAHTKGKTSLLNQTEVTSTDFNSVQALVGGKVNSFLGFTFHWIETREEGGMPKAGSVFTGFAYHGGARGATGMAVGLEMFTDINWIPEKTSWLINGLFDAGAVLIDPAGVYRFTHTES